MKKIAAILGVLFVWLTVAACSSDADVASHNLSRAAEYFEVQRRIVGINGITDQYLFEIEGRCSLETTESALGNALEVTCKVADDQYTKTFLGLSDNVTFVSTQLEPLDVSVYHTRIVLKPQSAIPDIDIRVGNP